MNKKQDNSIIESNMGTYLQMPYNRYLWLRLEFMAICGDEIEAKILRIVEYEIEGDRDAWLKKASALAANNKPYPPAPEQWWVTLSYKQIMTKMYGTVKNEKTIINKLHSLIQVKQYLQKRPDPENPYGAPQYTINKEVVQGKLDKLPALPMVPDVAKLYSEIKSEPVPASGTPASKANRYQLVVPPVPASGTPGTSEWNPPVPASGTEEYQPLVHINNSKNTKKKNKNKEEESIAPSVALSPASQSSLASFSEEERQEEQSPIVEETTRNAQSVEQKPLMPDLPSKSSSKKKERHTEPLTPKKAPEMPSAEMAWGTKKCLLMFDAWRGSTLIGYYKLTQASTFAKGLAEQYTEDDVRRVYQSMSEDEYWKERGGPDIGNVASNIHKEIKKVKSPKKPASQPEASARPSFLVSEEQKQKNIAKLRALAAAKAAKEQTKI